MPGELDLFGLIDNNESGAIEMDEFLAALLGTGLSHGRLAKIFASIDSDGSAAVSRSEFERMKRKFPIECELATNAIRSRQADQRVKLTFAGIETLLYEKIFECTAQIFDSDFEIEPCSLTVVGAGGELLTVGQITSDGLDVSSADGAPSPSTATASTATATAATAAAATAAATTAAGSTLPLIPSEKLQQAISISDRLFETTELQEPAIVTARTVASYQGESLPIELSFSARRTVDLRGMRVGISALETQAGDPYMCTVSKHETYGKLEVTSDQEEKINPGAYYLKELSVLPLRYDSALDDLLSMPRRVAEVLLVDPATLGASSAAFSPTSAATSSASFSSPREGRSPTREGRASREGRTSREGRASREGAAAPPVGRAPLKVSAEFYRPQTRREAKQRLLVVPPSDGGGGGHRLAEATVVETSVGMNEVSGLPEPHTLHLTESVEVTEVEGGSAKTVVQKRERTIFVELDDACNHCLQGFGTVGEYRTAIASYCSQLLVETRCVCG